MAKSGAVNAVIDCLKSVGVDAVVFDKAVPNPTDKNVADGLDALRSNGCDFIVSFGGGSSHDCAKVVSGLGAGAAHLAVRSCLPLLIAAAPPSTIVPGRGHCGHQRRQDPRLRG